MKVTIQDIRGEIEVHTGVEISLIDSKGILVISTPHRQTAEHRVIRTYILRNLISYTTEAEPQPKLVKD